MAVLFANKATGRLASSVSLAQTTISLQSGQGARFPSPSGGDWFPVTLIRANGDMEILRCTARSNDVLTVARAQEATTAREFAPGDRVELRMTNGAIEQLKTDAFPSGGIILWSGAIDSLPDGWALCNGSKGTPDLRNRFVVGAGSTYAVGATGGAATVTLTTAQIPSHNHTTGTAGAHTHGGSTGDGGGHSHTGTTAAGGSHNHGGSTGNTTPTTGSAGGHSHTASTNSTGAHAHQMRNGSSAGVGVSAPNNGTNVNSSQGGTTTAGAHSHTVTINTGGAHTHTVSSHSHSISTQADHTHTFTTSTQAAHSHSISSDGGHTHSVDNTGGGESHENLPPYYALAYIMKL